MHEDVRHIFLRRGPGSVVKGMTIDRGFQDLERPQPDIAPVWDFRQAGSYVFQ